MSNNLSKPGIRQVQKGLSERVAGLEQNLARILVGINSRFQGGDQRLQSLEEHVEALLELNGAAEVMRIMNEKRAERAQTQAAAEKAALLQGVADGYVVSTDKVEEKSIIVGQYTDKDGSVIEPGRAQLVVPGVDPQYREKLIGQVVGFTIDTGNGNKFTLQEIYNVDEEKAKAFQAAKQKEAQEAAAKAAQEQAAKDEATDTTPTEALPPGALQQDGPPVENADGSVTSSYSPAPGAPAAQTE